MAPPSVDKTRVKSFTVTWTGLVSYVDSIMDLDDKPDLDSLSGSIAVLQTVPTPMMFRGPNPFTLWPVRQRIDLTQGQGRTKLTSCYSDAIQLVWRWRARFSVAYKGVPVPIPDAVFMGGPDDVIDLTSFIGRSGEESFFFENPVGSGLYAFYQGTMESDAYGIIPPSSWIENPPGSGLYEIGPT